MDQSNYNNIRALAASKSDREKVKLLLSEVNVGVKEVPDPYWDDDGFEKVYQLIESACEVIAEKL